MSENMDAATQLTSAYMPMLNEFSIELKEYVLSNFKFSFQKNLWEFECPLNPPSSKTILEKENDCKKNIPRRKRGRESTISESPKRLLNLDGYSDIALKSRSVKLDRSTCCLTTDVCHKKLLLEILIIPDAHYIGANFTGNNSNSKEKTEQSLINYISDAKSVVTEILILLDLLEKSCTGQACEETARIIKLLYGSDERLSPEEIDGHKVNGFIRRSAEAINESQQGQDFDHASTSNGKKILDSSLDLQFGCQARSISDEELQKDLKDVVPQCSSSKDLENNEIGDETKHQKPVCDATLSNDDKKSENFPRRKKGETQHLKTGGLADIKEEKAANTLREKQLKQENWALKRELQKLMVQKKTRIDREIELEDVNNSLQKQLELLQIKYRDTLAELGQITVAHSSKANEERNSKLFQQIYRSTPPEPKRSLVSTCNDRSTTEDLRPDYPSFVQYNAEYYGKISHANGSRENGCLKGMPNDCTKNCFPKGTLNGSPSSAPSGRPNNSVIVPQKFCRSHVNDVGNPHSAAYATRISLGQQPVQGAKAMIQKSNNQVEEWKEDMTTGDQNGSKYRARDQTCPEVSTNRHNSEPLSPLRHGSMKRTSNCLQKEESRCGEGINQFKEFEDAKRTSDLKSTSKGKSNEQTSTCQNCEDLSFSIQLDDSSGRENISLDQNVPHTSVATILYNNYKLLLLTLTQRLLSCDLSELKNWANQKFSIDISQNSADVLFKLDKKRIIHASNLGQLRDFFESILRIDLVCIIDAFLLGDYSLLRQIPTSKKRQAEANGPQNLQLKAKSAYACFPNEENTNQYSSQGSADTVTTQMSQAARNNSVDGATLRRSADRNLAMSRKPENNNEPRGLAYEDTHKAASPHFSAHPNTCPKHYSRTPNENQATGQCQQQNFQPNPTGLTDSRMPTVSFADGPDTCERTTTSSNSLTSRNPPVRNQGRTPQTVGSNGLKLSKFRHPDIERSNVSTSKSPNGARNQVNGGDEDCNWLCSHYKRRCYVKFECCDKFWPCHRCHNNQSTCGRKKLKSRDTKMVKCVNCNKAQQFGQFCCDCNTKFANYYCGLCKHLTGEDDHPYHCDKCGICRIHGDRSFHCDICGVCLDVQLRGSHKCREGSAHDECCICLEDAFTGCQILPCSHKVHKDCATQMIRSGITRCPICRESFAHKLERRPLSKSQKRFGK